MSYFGGKGQDGVYQAVINEIPPHRIYREVFLGGGSIMLKKRPAQVNYANELNQGAITAFKQDATDSGLFPPGDLLDDTDYKNLFIHDTCGIEVLEHLGGSINDYKDQFTYADPPYLHETRKSRTRYKFEFTLDDHVRLLEAAKRLNSMIAISHYPNPLYDQMLAGWRTIDFQATDRSGERRTERLYMNYDKPDVLHDDRYLGCDRDCRQRNKRKVNNLVDKLSAWEPQVRARALRELLPSLTDAEKRMLSGTAGAVNHDYRGLV